MSALFPTGVAANGNVKVVWVNTIADPAAPTATELNAAGAVDLSCVLTGDGFSTGYSQETSEDARLCSTQVFQSPGAITYTVEDLTYIVTPQDDSPTGENKAAIQLTPGEVGFLVVRWGTTYSTAFAADDVVDVFPGALGGVAKVYERNAKIKAKQGFIVTAPGAQLDVAVA
jgi:hypothetical protein